MVPVRPALLERRPEPAGRGDRVVVQEAVGDLRPGGGAGDRRIHRDSPAPPGPAHAGHLGERGRRRFPPLDQQVHAPHGPPRQHIGTHLDPGSGHHPVQVVHASLHRGQHVRRPAGVAQGHREVGELPQPGVVAEEVGHHVVDAVVVAVTRRPGGATGGRRHHAQRSPQRRQPLLLGPVVEGVPFEVVGVLALRMPRRHRHEDRRHAGPAGGEYVGGIVRRCADQICHAGILAGR